MKGLCNIQYKTDNRVWTINATRRESGFIDGNARSSRGVLWWLLTAEGEWVPNSNYVKLPVYVKEIIGSMINLLQTKDVITQKDVNLACRYQ